VSEPQFESFELKAAGSQIEDRAGVPEVMAIIAVALAFCPISVKSVKNVIRVKLNQ